MSVRAWAATLAAVAVAFTGAVTGHAYLTDSADAVNVLHVDENTVEVTEDFDPVPDADGHVRKVVVVRNCGTAPCFVRAFARPSSSEAVREMAFNEDGWGAEQEDGYRYYGPVLAPGDETAPLMSGLTVEGAPVDVTVYVESVQSQGFASAQEAFAMFAERGRQ